MTQNVHMDHPDKHDVCELWSSSCERGLMPNECEKEMCRRAVEYSVNMCDVVPLYMLIARALNSLSHAFVSLGEGKGGGWGQ